MAFWHFIFLLHFLPCNKQTSADSIVKITVPEVIAYSRKSGVIHVYITVKKGYHIQANKVKDEFIIPTTLEINSDKIIITGKQVFPAGKELKLEGASDYLLVYDGNLKITIPFRARQKIKAGKYTLDAKLHYQACDYKTCFFPKTIYFSIVVKVI